MEFFLYVCKCHLQKRRPRWSVQEKEVLVEEVEKVHARLFGKFSKTVTDAEKSKMWDRIVGRIFRMKHLKSVCCVVACCLLVPFFTWLE